MLRGTSVYPKGLQLSLTGLPNDLVLAEPGRRLLRKGIVRVASLGVADTSSARPTECCVYVFTGLIVLAAPRNQRFREAICLSEFATLARAPARSTAATQRLSLPLSLPLTRSMRQREVLVLECGGRWVVHAEAEELGGWEADIRQAIPLEELC